MPLFGPPNVRNLTAKRDVKGLIKALTYRGDLSVRRDAAHALGELGDERAVEPLLARLKDSVWMVRAAAAWALGELGDARAVEPLIVALQDPEGWVRGMAASALGEIGDTRAIEPLLASLEDDRPASTLSSVSFYAGEALAKMGDFCGVEAILEKLNTEDETIRLRAFETMAKITGDTRVVEPLITALASPNSLVQKNAVGVLRKIGKSAVEPLIAALTSPNDASREGAAWALGEIGDKRAVEPLIAALQDPGENVREKAAQSLAGMPGPKKRAVEPLIAVLQDRAYGVRISAARALGEIGDARAVEPLAIALDDNSADVCNAAAEALKKIGSPRAMELIELSKRKGAPSIESLTSPVFRWSGNDFAGPNKAWVDKVRQENSSAISWFDAQGFTRIPTFAGDAGAAEYCFDMATQAQNSGNVQQAWAGFHQALRRFAHLQNEKMLALTCFNLGKVYGVRQNWEMARLMFLQSAYLANKTGKEDGYAWALFYLGDTSDKLGDKELAIQFMSEALPAFQRVSPNDVPGVQAALRRLTES